MRSEARESSSSTRTSVAQTTAPSAAAAGAFCACHALRGTGDDDDAALEATAHRGWRRHAPQLRPPHSGLLVIECSAA